MRRLKRTSVHLCVITQAGSGNYTEMHREGTEKLELLSFHFSNYLLRDVGNIIMKESQE